MARKWRRLYSKLVENEDLAMAGEECEFAERLFFRMIATCDDYGRLPGSAFGLASRACPGIGKSAKQIMEAVEVLATHNLIERYQVDGNDYIRLPGWFEHQAQKWFATGSPEYPAPPEWEPPASLLEWLAAKRDAKGELGAPIYPPSRYGLDDSILDSLPKSPTAEEATEATPEATHGASIDATDEAQEIEKEVEKINDNGAPAPAEKTDDLTTRQAVASEFQRLWPTGIPDDVRDPIMRETVATDPQIAVMAARKTASKFEHQTIDRWKIRDYFISTAQGMTLDARGKQQHDGVTPSAEGNPEPYVFAWLDRTPEEQERIDAQAQRMFDEEKAELAAAKAANGGGGA